MTEKRKYLSKKIRFEIFKRDSFTCQYCGVAAPDVVLHVDHIKPVAGGGDNDITNLITSCQPCNSGKGARELNDKSVLEKQKRQLDELNERRTQLEMMVEWREGMQGLEEQKIQAIKNAIADQDTGLDTSTNGEQNIKKWLKKHSLAELLDAVDISFTQYIERSNDGDATRESWEKAFSYTPRIAGAKKQQTEKPYMRDLYYMRGILRNRLNYVNDWRCIQLLEEAYLEGVPMGYLRDLTKTASSWSRFQEEISEAIENVEGEGD